MAHISTDRREPSIQTSLSLLPQLSWHDDSPAYYSVDFKINALSFIDNRVCVLWACLTNTTSNCLQITLNSKPSNEKTENKGTHTTVSEYHLKETLQSTVPCIPEPSETSNKLGTDAVLSAWLHTGTTWGADASFPTPPNPQSTADWWRFSCSAQGDSYVLQTCFS